MNNKNPCFPTFEGRCVSYGGRPLPFLKVEEGDSIDDIIIKIDEALGNRPTTEETQKADLSVIGDITSVCANKIKRTSFSYEVDTSRNTGDFSYNFEDTIKSIPNDLRVVKEEVEIITKSMNSSTLKGGVGGASLKVSEFPIRATFKIDVGGECGIVQLRREATIRLEEGKTSATFEVRDFGSYDTEEPLDFKDSLEIMAEAIKSLDSKFNNQIEILKEENRKLRKLIG